MIFLFNTPVLAGFGNYLIPLMIGSRDMAFPRLNAFSYWIFVLAAHLPVLELPRSATRPTAAGSPTCRSPSKQYSPGINIDFWGLGVVFVGISTTVGAINFIVTIFKLRAPGMTLNRMPIFVWSMLVFSFMVHLRGAGGDGRGRRCSSSTGCSARPSTSSATAAARCSTSTSSGSGAIPRCTSSSSRPPA